MSGFLRKLREKLSLILLEDIGRGIVPPPQYRTPSPVDQSVKRDFSLSFPQKTEKLAKAYYFQRNRTNFQEELLSLELKKYEEEQKLRKKAYYDTLRQKQNLSSQQFDPKSIKMPFAFFYDKELQIERLKRFYPEVAQAYGISLEKKYVDTMV